MLIPIAAVSQIVEAVVRPVIRPWLRRIAPAPRKPTPLTMLAAMRQAPGEAWAGWAALVVMAAGAVLTFAYSVRIVFGGFVDGRDPRPVHGSTPGLFLPAALPIVVSVPLAFAVMVLVSRATPRRVPVGVDRFMVRLHTPETVPLDRG